MKNFKKVISAVVALALSASTFVSASSFTDVADTASYAEAIDVLSALGIVNGYAEEDGTFTFKPEGTITRAEAATMIVGALNMTADAQASAGTSKFADVNSQASWATGYVNVGVAQGFISGMDDTTFAPQENVTYAQMCVMLTSIAGYGEYAAKNGGYPTGYTSMAASTGINKGVAVSNDTALTRGQVAQMIWNALQAPMLGVYEYSFQGNTYTQLDGKSGRDFKTLLSDKFDGYVVTADVLGTAKSGAPGGSAIDNGEALINITKADWWEDEVVPCGVTAHGSHNETVILDGVSLDDQLYQIGKAVLVINEDDDVELVYFAASTKTETKEFPAEDYVEQTKLTTGGNDFDSNGKLRFGSKYYTMNTVSGTPSVSLYVNGTAVSAAVNNTNLDKYLKNAQGTIKLVKTDADAGYSKIFVTKYDIAEVESVNYKNNQTEVVLTPASTNITRVNKIIIDDDMVEDGDVTISVKNGDAEIALKDLQEDDIIAFALDTEAALANGKTASNPAHIEVLVSRDTVSGKVTGTSTDDETYSIDGTAYAYVVDPAMTVGSTYTARLDPFGRIYDREEDASSTKYAIVEKWNSSSETVTLILADGTSKSYELSSNVSVSDITDIIYGAGNTSGTKQPVYARVVEYTIKTSDNTLRTITPAAADVLHSSTEGAEYTARTNKLGSATVNASTNVVNAEDYQGSSSDYETFAVDNFVDGTKYDAYAFKPAGSVTYSFILLTRVGTAFNETSRFAVVKSMGNSGTYNDEDAEIVEVLAGGEVSELYFYSTNSLTSQLAVGDAFYFEIDSDGFVEDIYVVYDHSTATFNDFAAAGMDTSKYDSTTSDGWIFDLYDNGRDIQLVYAVVAEAAGGAVTLAPVNTTSDIDTNKKVASANATIGGNTYVLADDAEVYVYDTADTYALKESDKVDTGSVIASAFSMFETAKNSKVYTLDSGNHDGTVDADEENRNNYTNYAVAMIVDGDIVEIYTINK